MERTLRLIYATRKTRIQQRSWMIHGTFHMFCCVLHRCLLLFFLCNAVLCRPLSKLRMKKIVSQIKGVDEAVMSIDEDKTVCKTLDLLKPDIFANGGDRKQGNVPEYDVCIELGITMAFGVGGNDKPQSSSWLVDDIRNTNNIVKLINSIDRTTLERYKNNSLNNAKNYIWEKESESLKCFLKNNR